MAKALRQDSARAGMVLACLVLLPGIAAAQGNCQWYATTALKQQQDNERLGCGYKGLAWHSDLRAHLAWCASVAPELWRSEAQKRDQEIAKCAAAKR